MSTGENATAAMSAPEVAAGSQNQKNQKALGVNHRRLIGYQRACRGASRTAPCIGSGLVFSLSQDNLAAK
jgi:hypothetical protein